jgi:plastocyanin
MLSIRLAAISATLMFAIACGSYSPPSSPASPSPSPTPPVTPSPGAPSSSVTIPVGAESLGNRAYVPGELDIAVGTTVTWMNTDSTSHTSTSNAAGWDSGIVAPGGQFSFAFQNAGTFPYHCAIHPGMVGTVVVR